VTTGRSGGPPSEHSRKGAWYGETDGEPTLVGIERYDQLESYPVLELRQIHLIQRRAIWGLDVLLPEVLILGMMAMVGVAEHWFTAMFALEVLSLTITPSFAAWLIILRWAFPQRGS
jgi:hypothetical protein